MADYEYYKHHAWAAGLLMSMVLALANVQLIDMTIAGIALMIVVPYLLVSLVFTYRHHKERSKEVVVKSEPGKSDAKLKKKLAKNRAKAAKKASKS